MGGRRHKRFPAPGVVVDNCILSRLDACGVLSALSGMGELHLAPAVHDEFVLCGPERKAVLRRLRSTRHVILPGTAEWKALSRVRGAQFSTMDLGEDESIAISLVEAERGNPLPLVTCDRRAARRASEFGVVSLDFLTTLVWLADAAALSFEEANRVERAAAERNGWKRPPGYSGALEDHADHYQNMTIDSMDAWRSRLASRPSSRRRR